MSAFKCKMCGGALEIRQGDTVVECEYCGAKQTLPKLDDEKRLYEILAQMKSRLQMALPSHGHSTAVTRAMSYFSESSDFSDRTGGISFYRMIEKLEGNFAEEKEHLIQKLREACTYIFCPDNLLVSVTCERKDLEYLEASLRVLQSCLKTVEKNHEQEKIMLEKKNEGFLTFTISFSL